jgi:hypothetical protein
MLTLVLLSCQPSELSVQIDSGGLDSASPGDTDTDTDTDEGVDFSTWSGAREFSYDVCKGRLEETGERLGEDSPILPQTERYCGDCDHWYELDIGPDVACGFDVTQRSFRGLRLQEDDAVEIFYMDVGGEDGGLLATGAWEDPTQVTYEYYIDTIRLSGVIDFERTSD